METAKKATKSKKKTTAKKTTTKRKGKAKVMETEELSKRIDDYFATHEGFHSEFSLATHIGVSRKTLVNWLKSENDEKREVVEKAFDRLAAELVESDEWNGKFTNQKALKMMEQERYGGFNTRVEKNGEKKVNIVFGDNMDKECMK